MCVLEKFQEIVKETKVHGTDLTILKILDTISNTHYTKIISKEMR